MFNRQPPQPDPKPVAKRPDFYPLTWLALDLDTTAEHLAMLLGDQVVRDGWHRPAVAMATAAEMVTAHDDAIDAEQERRAQADAAWRAQFDGWDPGARVRAIAAKQERMRRTGELDDDADTLTAIGYTADVDVRAEAEADRHADMARGVSSGGTFRIPHEDQ